uniref:Uncharacterized protein n=1 Tax=Anopheles minimus TaxID=112268 RepID=A0A182WQD6_9DIPT
MIAYIVYKWMSELICGCVAEITKIFVQHFGLWT